MVKFLVSMALIFCIWQNAYSQLLYPKEYSKDNREEKYLPPYDPNVVIISPDVEKWMNEQLTKVGEKKTIEMKTDILGRVKSSTDKAGQEAKVVESKQKRLVVISDMHMPEIDIEPMHGYSEYNSETKGYNYYLNGKKISIKEYENLMEKHWKKFDSQNKGKRNLPIPGVISSDSRIWTALMTAEEISTLIKNYKELAISDYIDPVNDDVPVADILKTIQLSTHAFPNNYTGNGVGVGVVEASCREASFPIKNISKYTNNCTGTTSTHHSRVVNIVQYAAPDAHVFGFRSSTPHQNPDSYSPPLQVVTNSYTYTTDSLYSDKDRDMDNYIYNYRIIGFKSAGNTGNYVTSPGKALNIITVGAVCPAAPCVGLNGTTTYVTNGYVNYSSWKNSVIGNEKPEAATYTEINMGNHGTLDGTSASTPLLAATMASLLDECTFCRRQPAMMKTALINSENIPIQNARAWDSDNSKSAQGIVDFSTLAWNAGGAWWDGGNSDFFDSNNEIIFIENNVNAGRRHKVTISWLNEGTYIYSNKKIQQDLDLSVYQNGQYLASSASWDNPFETVEFVAPTSAPLRVVIKRYRNGNNGNNGGRVILGYNIKYL